MENCADISEPQVTHILVQKHSLNSFFSSLNSVSIKDIIIPETEYVHRRKIKLVDLFAPNV